MNYSILAGLLTVMLAIPASAQRVSTAELGLLELEYAVPRPSSHYMGPPMAAEVGFRSGEAFSVVSPYRIQRISYLVEPGAVVTREQPLAVLSGAEIRHFLSEFEFSGERLELARRRFESNRALYRNRTIDEARWIEISDAYYRLQLEYEHLHHFHELLEVRTEEEGGIILKSPLAGRVLYGQERSGIAAGEQLASVVPPDAMRLWVEVPLARRQGLESLSNGACSLPVTGISGVATGFFLRAWSAPLSPECPYLPGERLMVTPSYQRAGYQVPRAALLHWQGEPAVLLRNGRELELVTVEVLAGVDDSYFVDSAMDLADREILVRSVSAVQGVLLGLGSE